MYLYGFAAAPPIPSQPLQPKNPTFPQPPLSPQVTATTVAPRSCPMGYTFLNNLCASVGCIDGRSKCVVIDASGQKCSYDALLAYQHSTGTAACPPPPVTVVQPQPSSGGTPTVQPQPPDASVPGGGTTVTPDGGIVASDGTIYYPNQGMNKTKKAWLIVGGVLVGVSVLALLAWKR
jgi:hypothetical protein